MGTSTNAILFYGICWDEEDHIWPWAVRYGTLPKEMRARLDSEGDAESDEAWLERNLPGSGLEIGEHCMASCKMGYVAVSSTSALAWRGGLKKLDLVASAHQEYTQEQVWRQKLADFCAVAGYDFDHLDRMGRVGWFLCAWWSE